MKKCFLDPEDERTRWRGTKMDFPFHLLKNTGTDMQICIESIILGLSKTNIYLNHYLPFYLLF